MASKKERGKWRRINFQRFAYMIGIFHSIISVIVLINVTSLCKYKKLHLNRLVQVAGKYY
jgi:hypothetical protein